MALVHRLISLSGKPIPGAHFDRIKTASRCQMINICPVSVSLAREAVPKLLLALEQAEIELATSNTL